MLSLLLLGVGEAAWSARYAENDLRAVYLFNFGRFVLWPADALEGESFRYCMAADDVAERLRAVVQGERIGGLPVSIRLIPDGESLEGCHVLYLGSPLAEDSAEWLERAGEWPALLTVGEERRFAEEGGMIGLTREGSRMMVVINQGAVGKSRLRISSKLIRMGKVIEP